MSRPGGTRVRWNEAEKASVAQALQHINDGTQDRDEMWVTAQTLAGIAAHRRRQFTDASFIKAVLGPGKRGGARQRKTASEAGTPSQPAPQSTLASEEDGGAAAPTSGPPASSPPTTLLTQAFVDRVTQSDDDEIATVGHGDDDPPSRDELQLMALGAGVRLIARTITDALKDAIIGAFTNPQVSSMLANAFSGVQLRAEVITQPPAAPAQPTHAGPPQHATTPREEPPPVGPMPHLLHDDAPRSNNQRTRLPRILVAGISPKHIEAVRSQFRGRCSFIFFKVNEPLKQLQRMVQGADAAIGMVQQLGHSGEQLLKARVPNYYPAHGNGSMLSQIAQALKIEELERGIKPPNEAEVPPSQL